MTTRLEQIREALSMERVCENPRRLKDGSFARCGSTDPARCSACAHIDARRSAEVISSGYAFVDYPAAFLLLTLTAPSFGKVHTAPHSPDDEVKRCACGEVHIYGAEKSGVPMDTSKYRYAAQVRWNAGSSALLDATMERIRYSTPDMSYVAIREYQARGTIHIHAIIRVPSEGLTEALQNIQKASGTTHISRDYGVMKWGRFSDVQVIGADDLEDTSLHLARVGGYASKTLGVSESRLSAEQRDHALRLDAAARRIGLTEKQVRGYGYGGHLLSKGRGWSDTTKKSLAEEARQKAIAAGEDSTRYDLRALAAEQRRLDVEQIEASLGITGDYTYDLTRVSAARSILGTPLTEAAHPALT